MEPLITVIVPVYKVEKYLDRCVESIVNQTYTNLEIILVDDGSPDNCPQMCDAWAEKDNRIKVIHKENGGVSSARNAALDIAKGDYIGFVDSDDYVDKTMYEKLYQEGKEKSCDLVICNNYNVIDDKLIKAGDYKNYFYSGNLISCFLTGKFEVNATCNKMYKRIAIGNIRFDESLKVGEDLLFNYYVIKNCDCVITIEDSLYYYVFYDNSTMRTVNQDVIQRYLIIKKIVECEYNSDNYDLALIKYQSELLVCLRELLRSDNKKLIDECYQEIVNEIKTYNKDFLKFNSVSIINRASIIIISINPNLFRLLYVTFLRVKQ
ncbi:MAG: glycosyltransferase [Eubacterium sp.]|nr:glycosyltransferase [Eubacterium sp.]